MRVERDEKLLEFATPKQAEKLLAYWDEGSYAKASKKLGINKRAIGDGVKAVLKKAARAGYAPQYDMHKEAAPGFYVRGTSTLYDQDGNLKIQWVKTDIEKQQTLDKLREAVEAIIEPCRNVIDIIAPPKRTNKDLLTVYPIPDVHAGMYSWGEESGDDYDTDKAVSLLTKAQARLIAASPESETCLIANLADYFHADTMENKTLRSGHILDVDTRWARILQMGVKAFRNVIVMALKKHKSVVVRFAIGNHDDHSIVMLAMAMKLAFENNPRVDIEIPINPFTYYQFGKVLIGMTHEGKPDKLPGVMAADVPKEWGETDFRYWYTAHIHHSMVNEYPGCIVESFRTIAAKDAWTHRMGYRSGRDMQHIVHHRKFGEVERARIGIEAIR